MVIKRTSATRLLVLFVGVGVITYHLSYAEYEAAEFIPTAQQYVDTIRALSKNNPSVQHPLLDREDYDGSQMPMMPKAPVAKKAKAKTGKAKHQQLARIHPASHGALLDNQPKPSVRDNLRPDMRYSFALHTAGFNNQAMFQFNHLHLLNVTARHKNAIHFVPIIPPLTPDHSHVDREFAPLMPFGKVFDLPRLAEALGTPIVEWHELKEARPCCGHLGGPEGRHVEQEIYKDYWNDKVMDDFSCWAPYMTTDHAPHKGRGHDWLERILGFQSSWTPIPDWVLSPESHFEKHMILYPWLSSFLSPPDRKSNKLLNDWLTPPYASAQKMYNKWDGKPRVEESFGVDYRGVWREPEMGKDGDIMCFDNLYWLSEEDGPWHTVAQHAHWSPDLLTKAWATIRKVINYPPGTNDDDLPPLIMVHIRRNDFMPNCPPNKDEIGCLEVDHFARNVNNVKRELEEMGIEEQPMILVGTDEKDPKYLQQIADQGWYRIDHEALGTKAAYGAWYPTLLDSAIFSLGVGMVGTAESTMTLLAQRRAAAWNPISISKSTHRWDGQNF